jgi:hypothetical protein
MKLSKPADLQLSLRPDKTFATFYLQAPVLMEIASFPLKPLRSAMMVEEFSTIFSLNR